LRWAVQDPLAGDRLGQEILPAGDTSEAGARLERRISGSTFAPLQKLDGFHSGGTFATSARAELGETPALLGVKVQAIK
jgi:hypothetical protein